jgi:hypothetical protein
MSSNTNNGEGYMDRGFSTADGILTKAFSSCSEDPKGSIHRAWGVSLIFVIIYFVFSVVESKFQYAYAYNS